jgi:hypothetical protein
VLLEPVIGSPGVVEIDFAGRPEVVIKPDPPEGLAGPKSLLQSLGPEGLERTPIESLVDPRILRCGELAKGGCRFLPSMPGEFHPEPRQRPGG